MISAILSLYLLSQAIFDPNNPSSCENYAPNHASGIVITDKKIRVSEIEGLYRNVLIPSLAIDWADTPYQRRVVKEFLRVTYGRDRRLHLYIKPTRKYILDAVDTATAAMLQTGQFLTEQCLFPDDYKPWEAALCVRKNDKLDDYAFSYLTGEAANGWPWLLCRNKAPEGGKIPNRAGADILSLQAFDVEPETLNHRKYSNLEYLVNNAGTRVSSSALLGRYRRFWDVGAGSMGVWYTGGPTARYKRLIERLDRWGSSPIPEECRTIPYPAPTPSVPFPPPTCPE